jgi:hypothetical protein
MSSRWKTRFAAACLASAVTASVLPLARADDAPKPAAAPAAKAAPTSKADDSGKPKLLPEVNVKDIALPDLIDFLRDVDPTFQAVVAYDPGASRGEPKIQELRLKNVTTDAVMELLSQTYPQIHSSVAPSGDDKGKIYMIRVEAVPQPPGAPGMFGGPGGMGMSGGVAPGPQLPPPEVTVVHRLREIVDDIAPPNAGDAERKKALDSVVSLVQATLETGAPSPAQLRESKAKGERVPPVSLKLHEGTETLIFHGSQEQAMIVGQALESLTPRARTPDAATKTQLRQLSADIRRLQQQVSGLQQSAASHGATEGVPEGATGLPGESAPGIPGAAIPGAPGEPAGPPATTPPGRPGQPPLRK